MAYLLHTRSRFFFLASLALVCACVYAAAAMIPRGRLRTVVLSLAWLATVGVALELGGVLALAAGFAGNAPADYVVRGLHLGAYLLHDPDLGYAPRPGSVLPIQKRDGDRVVFDATYTIGADGLRVSADAAHPPRDDARDVLFFGCSFTFGAGLNDADTLPAQVAARSLGDLATHNFAFGGYGPHQMLARLESARELPALVHTGEPPIAIYVALLPAHVDRAAGATTWDVGGPRYVIDEHAPRGVARTGAFHGELTQLALNWLDKSITYRELTARLAASSTAPRDDAAVETYLRIVAASKEIFEQRHGGRFFVLLWPETPAASEIFSRLFAERGIDAIDVADLLPGYRDDPRPYHIPGDRHPSALANARLAEALVARLRAESSR